MTTDPKFNVSDVDFTTIRSALKDYLKNQSQFSDYNFEGSALGIQLDFWAYVTHYMATYGNLVFSESFLDSATQRGSIVSRAKDIGYVPRSVSGTKATITLSFSVTGNPLQYIVPKGTKFSASVDNVSYNFVTVQDYTFENVSNLFSKDIEIVQGNFTNYTYSVDLNNLNQRFIIPSKKVDTDYLTVLWKESESSSDWEPYSNFKDIALGSIDGTTEVFYFFEAFDEFYEVYFGDGVLGKQLAQGNIVQLNYLITDGKVPNGALTFTLAESLSLVTSPTITTVTSAAGGSEKETAESVAFLAPLSWAAQNRAVTEEDYIPILKNNYSNIEDVAVWSGDKNIPPYYGKTFIAVKPVSGDTLSTQEKQSIQNDILKKYNILGIRPELVDADYIYVAVKSTVVYDAKKYDRTSNLNLTSDVTDAIEDFFSGSANKFGTPLYFSKLVTAIDATSPIITTSITNLTLQKRLEIISGIATTYEFNFNNSIAPNSIYSNGIIISGVTYYIKDVPTGTSPYVEGTLIIYNDSGTFNSAAGTVNYNTGEVILDNIKINNIVDDPIGQILKITVAPGPFVDTENPQLKYEDLNIYTNERDQIITLIDGGVTITLVSDNAV